MKLQDDALILSVMIEAHAICVVNVAAAVTIRFPEFPIQGKGIYDSGNAVWLDHCHSLLG